MAITYNTRIVRDQLYFHLDFANIKTYPGSGTTAFNLKKTGDFTLSGSPTIANKIVSFSGAQAGPFMFESSSLASQGTNSFTYQMLINPKSSTSTDSANEARIYEHSGFPTTYHILRVGQSGATQRFQFFGRGTDQGAEFSVASPYITSLLNRWYFVTTTVDRTNNLVILYVNDVKYQTALSGTTTSIGNSSQLRIPSSYAEAQVDLSCIMGYRKVLTEAEVKQNFEAVRGRYGI